jgi:hypothetical protein
MFWKIKFETFLYQQKWVNRFIKKLITLQKLLLHRKSSLFDYGNTFLLLLGYSATYYVLCFVPPRKALWPESKECEKLSAGTLGCSLHCNFLTANDAIGTRIRRFGQ